MWTTDGASQPGTLTCPFCGLACDDLQITPDAGGLPVLANGCSVARTAFATALSQPAGLPTVRGQPVGLDAAIAAGAALVAGARAPLFSGLVTDVSGMRACMDLADRCGALVDHVGGDALLRNLLVLQDGGWMTATLTEVRNRADLILVAGSECLQRFPRLLERVFFPPEALFSPPDQRTLVLLGPWDPGQLAPEVAALNPVVIPAQLHDLAGVCGLLRGLIAGRPVRADAIPGVAGHQLLDLAGLLQASRYGVVTWAAGELAFAHAELTVQALVELVRDLNQTTRAAALPLAGTLGDITVNQVCTWQTGYPLRSGRQQDRLRYEPHLYRHQDVLARDQCDLLLWVQALPAANPTPPPVTVRPTVVLGYPGMPLAQRPDVFIPVGLPGLDHPGHWYRTDAVCPLPLGQVRNLGLPSVAQVIRMLSERMSGDPCQC